MSPRRSHVQLAAMVFVVAAVVALMGCSSPPTEAPEGTQAAGAAEGAQTVDGFGRCCFEGSPCTIEGASSLAEFARTCEASGGRLDSWCPSNKSIEEKGDELICSDSNVDEDNGSSKSASAPGPDPRVEPGAGDEWTLAWTGELNCGPDTCICEGGGCKAMEVAGCCASEMQCQTKACACAPSGDCVEKHLRAEESPLDAD